MSVRVGRVSEAQAAATAADEWAGYVALKRRVRRGSASSRAKALVIGA
jgi:hypothetical protein